MKIRLFLLLLLLPAAQLFADCRASGLWAWPASKTIPRNPVIVLEGYANSQKIISELNKKHAVYLRCGNEKVKLEVTEILVGGFRLTQALLKPEKLLDSGKEYVLCVDSLGKHQEFGTWDSERKMYSAPSWKVTTVTDAEAPVWDTNPAVAGKTLIGYGCGPEISVNFSFNAKDDSGLLIKTTVRNLETNAVTTYYVKPGDKSIRVGHGMCSGEFDFTGDHNTNYTATFQLMDGAGNKGPVTEPVTFTPPTESTDR